MCDEFLEIQRDFLTPHLHTHGPRLIATGSCPVPNDLNGGLEKGCFLSENGKQLGEQGISSKESGAVENLFYGEIYRQILPGPIVPVVGDVGVSRVVSLRPGKVHPLEVGLGKVSSREVRALKVSSLEICPNQDRPAKVRPDKGCLHEVCADEIS